MSIKELINLKNEFLNKFLKDCVEQDVIKQIRKVLKEFKEQIYGGDNLQKLLSANVQSSICTTQSTGQSMNSTISTSKGYSKASTNYQQGANIQNIQSEVDAANIQYNTQQRFLLVAACEEIQKLLKYIVQPYIVIKSCIMNFESSQKSDQTELVNIIKQEFASIEKRIVHVVKNYSEVLPINILDTLEDLQKYYIQQKDEYIEKKLEDLEKLKQTRYFQIQAPYIGYHLVDETRVSQLFEKASIQIENLKIQRVGTEFVHHFQKYLTTYVFNKLLMDTDILSGVVVCIKDNKKKKTYFFIQYCDLKVEEIESTSSVDQQIVVTLNKYGQKSPDQPVPTKNVDMNSFFKQIAASFLSLSFESFIPNYGICSETGKIYRHQLNTTNEDRTAHAGIKNPLYFFKDFFMMEKKSSKEFQQCLNLKQCNMANFLEALTLLHEFQKTDFKFEFKKGKKLQSLYLSKDHINSLQSIVQEFSRTLVWLEESVFPVNGKVCLLQIMNQIQPLVIEFSNRIMSKSMQEHLGFMKKISIEDFLIKISTKKALKKYIQQNKSFEDNRFLKEEQVTAGESIRSASQSGQMQTPQASSGGNTGQQSQTGQQQNLNSAGTNLPAQGNSSNASTFSNYSNSSTQSQSHSLNQQQINQSGIQITQYLMELNLLNFHRKERKVILKYAAENLLYLPMILSLEYTQDLIKKFNKSWRSTQLWSDNYQFVFDEIEDDSVLFQIQSKIQSQNKSISNVVIPPNINQNYNNLFATPIKRKQSNKLSSNYNDIPSNENICSSSHRLNEQEKNSESYDKSQRDGSKQPQQQKQIFESIFVELLGLVFNMNIMSILTSQTFANLKYFDEYNSDHIYLIKAYFKFPQVRGDKGYKLSETLLERSIKLKKYKLACLLLNQGEGVNITKDIIFNYLSEEKLQPHQYKKVLQNNIRQISSGNKCDSPIAQKCEEDAYILSKESKEYDEEIILKMVQDREEFDQQLQQLVIKHHAQWLNEFNWEKMWRQEFNPENHKKLNEQNIDDNAIIVYTNEYGVRCLPMEIWTQIFDFKRIDSKKSSSENKIELSNNKIDEEQESSDENAATAKQKEGKSDTIEKKSSLTINDQNLEMQSNFSKEVLRGDSNKESPRSQSQGSQTNISEEGRQSKKQSPKQENEIAIQEIKIQQQQSEDEQKNNGSLNQSNEDLEGKKKKKSEDQDQDQNLNQIQEDQQENENKTEIHEENEEKTISRKESQNQPSRKSSKSSKIDSQSHSEQKSCKDVEENNDSQKLNEDQNNQGGQIQSENQESLSQKNELSPKNEIEDNENKHVYKKSLNLNLDETEDVGNETVRLSPLNSQFNILESLQEGIKLNGILEMKKFSYQDEKNYFISNYLHLLENSSVQLKYRKLVIVHCQNLDFLVEECPQYPGLAYAEDRFINFFSSHIKPKRMLVRINDVDYTFTQVLHNCISLQNAINQGLCYNLDKQSIGESILLNILIGKQHNGLEDEILEPNPNNPKEYRLVNISVSQPFSMQILRFNSVNYAINNRNVIFCLDQMNEIVDSALIMKYRQINPDKLLDDWLNDLYFFQQKITQQRIIVNNPRFIIKSQQNQEELNAQQNIQMNQAILFQKGMIKELYNRLSRFTKYLKKIHYDDHSSLPKYQDIFEAVSPHLADMYKRVNAQKDVLLPNRFEQILQNLDKVKSFVTCDIPSFYSHFTLEKIYNYESLEEVISTFKSIGPLSSKEIVKQLSKLQRKDNLQWDDIFQNVSKNSQIRTIMMNGYLENDWNDSSMVEKFINQLTAFQQKPVAEFKHLLSDLIFYSSDIVSWKMIRNLGHDRITTLSLKGCTKITDTDVVKISESMVNLVYLDLSKNQNIIKFNHQITSKYNQSKPLQFPQLKTLILEECVNLCICDIEGQHIQNINLNTCIQLQNLMTATPSLKRICLKTCPSLLEEHAILYIIEGTNCMIDEQTSGGAFRQTLLAMTRSTHSKLSTYKIYVLSIFGRLFNKIKILQDLYPLVFALNRRGLNKAAQNKESSSFFGFSKKTTTTSDSLIKNCRMSAINLLLKNSNIRELKFMNICEEFKDQNVSQILEILCEKFQESAQSTNKNELVTDIDTIDLSDIKLSEKNMKHLGEIISLIKTTSSQGLSIFIQNSQETQSKGMKYFCQGALKNEINKLDMSKNRFGAEQMEEICLMIEGVSSGQKLNQLFLKNCRINNDLLARLSLAIKKNETLRLLDLSDNLFDHEGFKIFMQSLYDNTNLTSLVLDGNSLSGQGFSYIKKGRFLKKLHLEQCWLEEYEIQQICELLKEQQQLNYIDLSFNKFNIKSTQHLVSSIKKSNCLKELVIKKIFDEEESIQNASHISEILVNNTSLQTLDISGNSIGNDGLIQFGKALQQNSVLRVLLINDDCNFGLRGIANLAELIQYNNTLQVLEIQGIENNQESKLEGFQAAWEMVKQKLHRNNLLRLSKFSSKKINSLQMPYQKKGNISPTHKSLDQSSFFMGGEKLDSTRIKGTSDHYRLGLSIDGGGMRGIIPGCIIQYLCQNTKREVHEIFDVLGGTSIGGILALALVCTIDGKNPVARGSDLPSFFEDNGTQIFNSSKMVALWNNLRDKSKYDPAGIESILKKYFQNCKLSDVIKGTSVITTAMKRENIQGKNMAKIFRSKEAMFSDDKNFYVRDIARATSAAPTYFPSAEIKSINGVKKYSLIDGALGQNNPSKLVLDDIKTEALNSGNEKNFFLLSLSTGTPITTQQISQNAGIFNLVPIINSLGEGALAFLDRDIEKSADGQYLRINPDIPIKKHEAELDNTDPKIIEIYKQCGYNCAEKFLSQDLKYGPFNDQNLLDWLAENTARKKDTYI